ncbi:MAG: class I SAM-dependent methyltransferase [Magnetospirillum sp.]|nr:class I SAM-dependent methyltransferase [Magnetospirillum sp.]
MERRRNTDVIVETIAMEGKRVIDVGCGDGHLSRHLARHGAAVLGVECSARQLAKAAAAEPLEAVEIVAGVGQSLPADAACADVVVFFNSLHHVPVDAMSAALIEAARVLKPGGLAYVSEPLPEGRFFEAVRPIDDETEVRARALAALRGAVAARLFTLDGEFTYVHPIVLADYEAFRDRIVSANDEREARFAARDAEMRDRFHALAEALPEGGFAFDQPMRVTLLRTAAD